MAEKSTPKKKVGRPKGEPSTIVNIRLPLTLVARLDRHVDWVEVHSGGSTNRGTLIRRALQMFCLLPTSVLDFCLQFR